MRYTLQLIIVSIALFAIGCDKGAVSKDEAANVVPATEEASEGDTPQRDPLAARPATSEAGPGEETPTDALHVAPTAPRHGDGMLPEEAPALAGCVSSCVFQNQMVATSAEAIEEECVQTCTSCLEACTHRNMARAVGPEVIEAECLGECEAAQQP